MSNTITIIGNLTRDLELRFTQGGRAVASGSVASSRRYQVNGEWQEDTAFFNLTIWGELGENAAQSLVKGTRVVIDGRIEQREYTDKDGKVQRPLDVIVNDIGASVRFATMEIHKVARDQADQSPRPAPASRPIDPVYGDEEPF